MEPNGYVEGEHTNAVSRLTDSSIMNPTVVVPFHHGTTAASSGHRTTATEPVANHR